MNTNLNTYPDSLDKTRVRPGSAWSDSELSDSTEIDVHIKHLNNAQTLAVNYSYSH